MAFQRKLWGETLRHDPGYPCPNCEFGVLENATHVDCVIAPLVAPPPGPSLFIEGLECTKCHQLVVAVGYEKKSGRVVKGMLPAPPLITLPSKTPPSVARELNAAFTLFWVDLGACANKLRSSVERVLENFQVPGKSLYDKIANFEQKDKEQAETFHALRQVGNIGSHEGGNTRQTILDAFEVYEHALSELFDERKAYFDRLRKKILQKNGK